MWQKGMHALFSYERLAIAFFIVASFAGVWHALPMLDVVRDEQYFVGAVLRAMEAKSIIPLGNAVPYGTLTFYLNYALHLPLLLVLLVWNGLSLAALQTYLIVHPGVAYIVPRIASALIASVVAVLYDRFLRQEGLPLLARFAALSVIFATIISTATLHTGKAWVLAFVLGAFSALCTYKALKNYLEGAEEKPYGPLFFSIVSAFATFANFPFNGIFLANIPVFLYAFRSDMMRLRKLFRAMLAGVATFVAIVASNVHGTYWVITHNFKAIFGSGVPVDIAAAPNPSYVLSALLHLERVVVAFPLVIILIALAMFSSSIRNRLLFFTSLSYACLFFVALVIIVPWPMEMARVLHYVFPLAFFFSGMAASIAHEKMRYVLWGFCALQTLVLLYVLYLLSVQTTFNRAAAYIEERAGGEKTLIVNDVVELSLPLNKKTALLLQDRYCEYKCQFWRRTGEDNAFAPLVVTAQSDLSKIDVTIFDRFLFVTDGARRQECAQKPAAVFESGSSDARYVSVEYNLGNYFNLDFWHLSRLGKNLKLYELKRTCAADILDAKE